MSVDLIKCSDNHKVRRLLSDRNNIELQIKEIEPDALIKYELEKLAEDSANEASTSHDKALDIDLVIETLKAKLEINAGRLAEPLLRQGKQPKEDKECHEAFIMCAHLAEIERYLSSR